MAEKQYKKNAIPESLLIRSIVEEYKAGKRFCFILGSGASVTSGVRMGLKLMEEWRKALRGLSDSDFMENARYMGIKEETARRLMEDRKTDTRLDSKDYFDLYDIRFANQPESAYQFLEDEMANKHPSIGYYALSYILNETKNQKVITTNFDSLTEDALYLYYGVHPVMVGHENLAMFLNSNARKPVVAKVHRDLYLRPMNRRSETRALSTEWKKPLSQVMAQYIPIVIGYAGADESLMGYMLSDEFSPRELYWCLRREDGGDAEDPGENVLKLIEKDTDTRKFVEIAGFDEFMVKLAKQFSDHAGSEPNGGHSGSGPNNGNTGPGSTFQDPRGRLREQAEERCRTYKKQLDQLKVNNETIVSLNAEELERNEGDKSRLDIQNAINALDSGEDETDKEKYDRLIREGNVAYFEKRDYQTACTCFEAASEIREDEPDLWFKLGYGHAKLGQKADAVKAYDRAIELDPDDAYAYNNRGNAYYALGQKERAIEDYDRAIDLDPDYAYAYNNRGAAYSDLGQKERAIEDYDRAIELKPDYAYAYNNRGSTYDDLGQKERAIKDYDKAIELKPDYANAYNNRGVAYSALGQKERAIKDFDRAIELDPDDAYAYNNRGAAYSALGQKERAIKDYDRAIELKRDYADAFHNRALSYEALGNKKQAAADRAMAKKLEKQAN